MSSVLADLVVMVLRFLGYAIPVSVFSAILYANLPTQWTIGGDVPSLAYLKDTTLIPLKPGAGDAATGVLTGQTIRAATLFAQGPLLIMAVRRPGCTFCRKEAQELATLRPQLDAAHTKFIAVVHETRGVDEFRKFFPGEVYYDAEKKFYGPQQRWMPVWLGFLRLSTWINGYNSRNVPGNFKGEGRLLGGVYVVNNDSLVYAHLERSWGDAAPLTEVAAALGSIAGVANDGQKKDD